MIDTRLVYGFLGAGKTTYIQDCIRNDFFHKRGTTLILGFEQGEAEYNTEKLLEKRTYTAFFEGDEEEDAFCARMIEKYHPDRIYVEMNAMNEELRKKLPDSMNVTSAVMFMDWSTLEVYLANFRQMINRMVSESQQVTFRGCPSKELLAPYGPIFRLMNRKASYLRQDPLGYHEKAFDLFLPYSLDEEKITITAENYLPFWLDAADHPEHYFGKKLLFTDPLVLRQTVMDGPWSAGRIVMTCCMADLQFMSFELADDTDEELSGGWITFEAYGQAGTTIYGRKFLKLKPFAVKNAKPPENLILSPANTKL